MTLYGNYFMFTAAVCLCNYSIISTILKFLIVIFLFLNQEDAKKDREDYILSLDEMSANDFPSPTDINKDTPETECNGK